jgi:hypothetical protein
LGRLRGLAHGCFNGQTRCSGKAPFRLSQRGAPKGMLCLWPQSATLAAEPCAISS